MKILVTGATGFIGRNLVKRLLLEKRYEIICVARKTSKVDFLKRQGAKVVIGDISSFSDMEWIFKEVRPDIVFHSAAKVSEESESKLYDYNVTGTRNICQLCYVYKNKKLIYLSSVSVISGNLDVPLTEGLPYKATSSYGVSKIKAERIVEGYRAKGLKTAIFRPCMVYGEDEPHALNKILRLTKLKRLPVLDISGMNSKLHLVYVGNVVEALMLALTKEEAFTGTFMVADKEVITLKRFVEIIYDELRGRYPPRVPRWLVNILMVFPPFRNKTLRIFKDRVYDITRAVDELGYSPSMSTEEGLRLTVKHWAENRVCQSLK
ncbi:MAG: NAD(P)-dependent oxidoreductase [Candidatus Omnitrophica bacterium]|nr:NAD(P)-dependent oxidoreductase [Candidatus Omnitrophota bacterium]